MPMWAYIHYIAWASVLLVPMVIGNAKASAYRSKQRATDHAFCIQSFVVDACEGNGDNYYNKIKINHEPTIL